jgi:hypothetical protein
VRGPPPPSFGLSPPASPSSPWPSCPWWTWTADPGFPSVSLASVPCRGRRVLWANPFAQQRRQRYFSQSLYQKKATPTSKLLSGRAPQLKQRPHKPPPAAPSLGSDVREDKVAAAILLLGGRSEVGNDARHTQRCSSARASPDPLTLPKRTPREYTNLLLLSQRGRRSRRRTRTRHQHRQRQRLLTETPPPLIDIAHSRAPEARDAHRQHSLKKKKKKLTTSNAQRQRSRHHAQRPLLLHHDHQHHHHQHQHQQRAPSRVPRVFTRG